MSWWSLGEGSGFAGSEFEIFRLICPFCDEKGNFELEHRATKRKPNERKTLYFDTYRCANCAGYVMVLWSASSSVLGVGGGLYGYHVLPWPQKVTEAPENWPEAVRRYWVQAQRNIQDENWDAAAVMARSALQVALRDNNAEGRNLRDEIDDLASKGLLPPVVKDWAHELRELGNDSAHPRPDAEATAPDDARDIVEFLDYLLRYLYDLPQAIERYRGRRAEPEAG
jgi:hypothetical protein